MKKKTDPVDGCAYSLAELEEKYKGKYKKKAMFERRDGRIIG